MKENLNGIYSKLLNDTIEKRIEDIQNTSIWEERPVAPRTFYTDWMKVTPYPIQQEAIDAILVEKRKDKGTEEENYHWSTKYNEAYLLHGEGSGKDFVCSLMMTYALYWMLCLKNPQKYFKFDYEKSPIDLVNVSFDEDQAKNVYFKYLKNALTSVINPKTGRKWFEEKGMAIKETSKLQIINFPKYISAYSLNSREHKIEGKGCIFAVFDEVAVFKVQRAREMYDNLKGNMKSRFPNEHKLICISYKRDDHDFMMIRWDETKNEEKVFRSGPYATWDVNKRVTEVDFKDAFEKNPEDAERRYKCIGTTTHSGYFKYREKIKENVNKNRQSPVIEETYPIRDIKGIIFKDSFTGGIKYNYHVHIDLAKGKDTKQGKADCCGFALGHIEFKDEEKKKPIVVVDLKMQLKAPVGREIYKLKSERDFRIIKVTLDGFQSTDFMQMLRANGIQAELLSVDKNTSAYDTLKELLYGNRLDYYYHLVFIRELEELKYEKGKVDHPEISRRRAHEENDERGSKDVSDSVAGICKSLIDIKKATVSWRPLEGEGKDWDKGMNTSSASKAQNENTKNYGKSYDIYDDDDDDEDDD